MRTIIAAVLAMGAIYAFTPAAVEAAPADEATEAPSDTDETASRLRTAIHIRNAGIGLTVAGILSVPAGIGLTIVGLSQVRLDLSGSSESEPTTATRVGSAMGYTGFALAATGVAGLTIGLVLLVVGDVTVKKLKPRGYVAVPYFRAARDGTMAGVTLVF